MDWMKLLGDKLMGRRFGSEVNEIDGGVGVVKRFRELGRGVSQVTL